MKKGCRSCKTPTLPEQDDCESCRSTDREEPVLKPLFRGEQFNQNDYKQKSRMTAGLLAIFLGFLGVHNFYLGYFGKGLAQILITVFSLGFAAWISWIWAVVEGVLLLSGRKKTDSNGFPLR